MDEIKRISTEMPETGLTGSRNADNIEYIKVLPYCGNSPGEYTLSRLI